MANVFCKPTLSPYVRRPRTRQAHRELIEAFEPRIFLSGTGNLAFDDEFNQAAGTQPSTAVWVRDVGTDPNNGAVVYTNSLQTLQVVNDPTATDGKALAMTIAPNGNNYVSARITTQMDPIGDSLQYGHISARIKLPSAVNNTGIWPAFWILGSNVNSVGWPESGEVDIMENKGSTPAQNQASLHAGRVTGQTNYDPTGTYNLPSGVFSSAYHVFAVDWTPSAFSFSVDGHVFETQNVSNLTNGNTARFQHPFYIILNIAAGGLFAGTNNRVTVPATMYVDYVRASGWQQTSGTFAMPNAPAFSDSDIGSPSLAGSAVFDGVAWIQNGSGTDIWGTSDQFNFAKTSISGDATIIAQVNNLTNTANFSKAGIMIRDGNFAGASYAFTFVTPNNSVAGEGTNFEYRNGASTSSVSANSVSNLTAPQWLKLTRAGNTFTAYYSSDGFNWTQNGPSETIAMGTTVNFGLATSSNTTSALNTAMFTHVSILPGAWTDNDIGSPSGQGSASYNASTGVWTVAGSGADIWNTADQFNFANQNLTGDGSVIAQVTSLGNTNAWAKAGVMLRNDTTAGSIFANVDVTVAQGVTFQWRATPNTVPNSITFAAPAAPLWVKVSRTGNTFRGYYSSDGITWTQIGTDQTLSMGSTALAGLAVTSHDNFTLNQGTFTNVSVLPVGWSNSDIGIPGLPGGASSDTNGTWTIAGSGADIAGTSDQFNFTSQSFAGDGSVVALVSSLTNTDPWAKAGVMFRNDMTAGSALANIDLTPGNGVTFQWRSNAGDVVSAATVGGITGPIWLKLTRAGNSFSGFYSSDASTWIQVGTAQAVAMNSSAMAGLAVSSHTNSALNLASFSSVAFAAAPIFASQSGSSLDVYFDSAADPISLGSDAANVTVTETGVTLSFSGVSNINIHFNGTDNDALNFSGPITAPLNLLASNANDSVTINSGILTLAAPLAGSGITPEILGVLSIADGAKVVLASPAAHSDRAVLSLGAISFTGLAVLDLNDNDMIVRNGNLANLTTQLQTGYNTGAWNGTAGIISSVAANTIPQVTGLAMMQNINTAGNRIFGTGTIAGLFDGQDPSSADILVKYTLVGDTDLDGQVNGNDYSKIDNGFNNSMHGWNNGDLNYDGIVDGSDYSLIDNAFNQQAQITFSVASTPTVRPAAVQIYRPASNSTIDESQRKHLSKASDILDEQPS